MDYKETIKSVEVTRETLENVKKHLGCSTYMELKSLCRSILEGINFLEENA